MNKTFTLIELLLSFIIIGILLVITVPIYNNYEEDSVKKVMEHNIKEIDKFIVRYKLTPKEISSEFYDESENFNFLYENIPFVSPFAKELKEYDRSEYFINRLHINFNVNNDGMSYQFWVWVTNVSGAGTDYCNFQKLEDGLYLNNYNSESCKYWFPNFKVLK